MQKILITGITGFIGSHLAVALENVGIEVHGTTNSPKKVNNKTTLIDFSNESEIASWIAKYNPDAIIHTAAITNVMHNDLAEIYRTNIIYTENLLNAIKRTCSRNINVIVVSTAGVYGNNKSEYIEETSVLKPNNHYSYSKLVVEHLCDHYREYFNINVVRPFNIIGTGQRENFLIPKLASCFSRKVDNVPLGNIDAVRDYLSIYDCVRVLMKLITDNEPMYGPINICSGIGYNAREIINIFEKISGHKLNYYINPAFVRKNEIWRLVGCTKKLCATMNESTVVTASFEDVLAEIYTDSLRRIE